MRSLRYFSAIVAATVLLAGCGKRAEPIVIGSGSENAAFYGAIEAFAKSKGQSVTFVSKGSVDLANDLALGTAAPYDVVWTASSSVLDGVKGHAVKDQMSVSVSPVMPIVKRSKAESLGWTGKNFTNADFYDAVTKGKLKFGMTSASQSFSGQAAYLGMLSSLSGNPEVLQASDLDAKGIAERTGAILKKVARSSASSGTLKTFMVANFDSYDAMLNYEGLAFEANRELAIAGKKDTFCALMPADGVVVADHPIGYVDKGDAKKAAFYKELTAYLKSPEFRQILKDSGRRAEMGLLASAQKSAYDPCWDTDRPIKQVTMPTSEVVAKAVDLYQTALRKPSLTVYVADFSGSMANSSGQKELKAAMRAVFDPTEARKWNLQPTAKDVNVFIPFSHVVWGSIEVRGNDPKAYAEAIARIEKLQADGGTEMYLGLNAALAFIDRFPNLSDYAVSIVLMTDGVSKDDGATRALNGLAKAFKERGVATYSVLFGEADQTQLVNIASHQVGGNAELAKAYVCDGRKDLVGCFRKVRANN